jgi:hypothetical protein
MSHKEDKARLAKGQTFRWLEPSDASSLSLRNPHIDYVTSPVQVVQRPDLEAMVRPEVEKRLVQEGYVPASLGSEPDLFVTYYFKAKDQNWVSSWSGATPGFADAPVVLAPDFDRNTLRSFRDGNVYLVLYSRALKGPAWTGLDMNLADQVSPTQADAVAAVDRMMLELKDTG